MTEGRPALLDGIKTVAPLLIGVIPFGLVFGVTAAGTEIGGGLGYATSIIIFAGAAQFATVQLIAAGSTAAVVIATAFVINARHAMYSAAMAPYFQNFPRWYRWALPYLLTDEAFGVSIVRFRHEKDPGYQRWFYIGSALALWTTWQVTTGLGVILGTQVPQSWSLDFALPLTFIALLAPVLNTRPAVAAAVVAGFVALIANGVSYNLGLLIGAAAGIAAGVMAGRVTR